MKKQLSIMLILFVLLFSSFSVFRSVKIVRADISNGLVLYWRFDEHSLPSGSGYTYDSSGNGYTGIIYNSYWADGKFNYALWFNSLNSQVYSTTNFLNLSTFTFACWINLSTQLGYPAIFGFTDDWDSGYGYQLGFNYPIASKWLLRIWNTPNEGDSDSIIIPNNSNWHFVTCSYDGSLMHIYLDSVESGTGVSFSYGLHNSSSLFRIGEYAGQFLNGTVDEVRMYDHALSQQTINELYNGFFIQSSCDLGSTISPINSVNVGASQSQTFTITNKIGYGISNLYINGIIQSPESSYTFSNVIQNHTIYATSFVLPNASGIDYFIPLLLVIFLIVCLILSVIRIPIIGFVFSIFTLAFSAYSISTFTIWQEQLFCIFVAIISVICLYLNADKFYELGQHLGRKKHGVR